MAKHRDVMGDAFFAAEPEHLESIDPMSGLTNLADCMLVLACGLMVALVVHWNLNMGPHYEMVEETGNMAAVEDDPELAVRSDGDSHGSGQGIYENLGTLYRDPQTGKMYYVREFPGEEPPEEAGE